MSSGIYITKCLCQFNESITISWSWWWHILYKKHAFPRVLWILLCHNSTAWFRGLHWMYGLVSFPWCSGHSHKPYVEWWGGGIHPEGNLRAAFHWPGLNCTYVEGKPNINPHCECRQTLLPYFYGGNCYHLFPLCRTSLKVLLCRREWRHTMTSIWLKISIRPKK